MRDFDTDQIDRYLRGELPPEEVEAFEAEMQSDKDLENEVALRKTLIAGIHHHQREKLRVIFEEEEKFFAASEGSQKPSSGKIKYLRPLTYVMAAAAIILILILLRPIVFPTPDPSSDQMFNQFAMHYTGGDLIRRNVDTCLAISETINIYDQKNYGEAIPKFQKIIADSTVFKSCNINQKDIELLLGISAVFEGEKEIARPILEELSQEIETARWYLILSYVQEGNWEEVKNRILQWENPSSYYEKRIRELEKSLP